MGTNASFKAGTLHWLEGPGIIYLIPIIDRAPLKISTRLDTIQFRTESTLTKDNVPVNVDSVLIHEACGFREGSAAS